MDKKKQLEKKTVEGVDNSSTPPLKQEENFLEQRKSEDNKPSQVEVVPLNQYNFETFVVEKGYIQRITKDGLVPIAKEFDVICTIRNLDDDTVSIKLGIDSFGKYKEIIVPFKDFTKTRFPKYVTKYGSDITETNAESVIQYIMQEKDKVPQEYCHRGLGFSTYENHRMFKHHDAINFPYKSQYIGHFNLTPTGSLDTYLEMVNTEVLGNTLLELILVLGFSAPVFALLSNEVLIVHLYGDSSKGKTTSIRLGVSPFIKPAIDNDGGIITWNGTENALIEILNNNNGIPLAFDEGSMHRGNLTRQIYKIASGTGRRRLNQDGTLKETGYWENVIFSTAEHSLLEKANNNTGLKVRVIEIGNRYFTTSAENAEAIEKTVLENYALAGQIFVQNLMEVKDTLESNLRTTREALDSRIEEKTPFTKRIVKKLALIVLTAQLVKKFLGINLNIDEIADLLLELESEKAMDIDIGKQAFEYFVEVLHEHHNNFIDRDHENPNILWGKIEVSKKDATRRVYILTNKFNDIMSRGGFESTQTVLNNWKDKNLLECDPKRLSKKKTLISGKGQARVYCIRLPRSLFPDSPVKKAPKKVVKSKIANLFEDDDDKAS